MEHPGDIEANKLSSDLRRVLDSAPTGIVAVNGQGLISFLNARAMVILETDETRALGMPLSKIIDNESVISMVCTDDQGDIDPWPWEERGVLVCCHPFIDCEEEPGRLFMMHQMEFQGEEVHRLRDEMSSLVENSYDGIIIADHENVLQVNASFGRITGVAPSLLIGKYINELDSERHVCLAAVQEIIRMTAHHRKSLTLQRRLRSGNEIFITGSPVFDRHGQVVRVILNIRDITELHSLTHQISKITMLCQELDQDKGNQQEALQGIVVESQPMKRLLELVMRVSQVDSIVLLQGESGVGKDVIARLIKRLSPRDDKPFIAVNCGAIPEALLESEFFGYEKGAFTSASRSGKPGLFEQANGGILFLDEVGELPFNLQVKLLKVIQDHSCRRVGGVRNIDLDLRIIAATNRDLRKMVADGDFREDLFYRLYVVPIEIAPLRERRDDILPLALMFLNQFNKKYDVSRTLGHELMTILECYDWPGNVRELQNVIERMVVTADSEVLDVCHLPNSMNEDDADAGLCLWMGGSLKLKQAREALEKQLIAKAFSQTGNTRKAAKLLGVDHSTVVRKAQKYGLELRNGS